MYDFNQKKHLFHNLYNPVYVSVPSFVRLSETTGHIKYTSNGLENRKVVGAIFRGVKGDEVIEGTSQELLAMIGGFGTQAIYKAAKHGFKHLGWSFSKIKNSGYASGYRVTNGDDVFFISSINDVAEIVSCAVATVKKYLDTDHILKGGWMISRVYDE